MKVPCLDCGRSHEQTEACVDDGLLDAARLHSEAVKIIATALEECSHPWLSRKDHERNAVAILARLAHANILLERYTG